MVVEGDIAESLRRLVAEWGRRLDASPIPSHLLWREADTHHAVRDALHERHRRPLGRVLAAGAGSLVLADADSASALIVLAVGYRHSVAQHGGRRPTRSSAS